MWNATVQTLITLLVLAFSTSSFGADKWTLKHVNGVNIAVTPMYNLEVQMLDRPQEAIWGKLEIPITPEQLPELHKHRKSPNFPFINVGIEVDRYYRTAQGHIHDDRLRVTVEVDLRQWEGMKKGNHLIISLPDGTEMKESLRGSLKVLREAEVRR